MTGSAAMAMRLPSPNLTRSGAIPTGDYACELELDGFRAIISRCNGSSIASRRSVTDRLLKLGHLPTGCVFACEVKAV